MRWKYRVDRNEAGLYRIAFRPRWWPFWTVYRYGGKEHIFSDCQMAQAEVKEWEAAQARHRWVKNVCPTVNGGSQADRATKILCDSAGVKPPCCRPTSTPMVTPDGQPVVTSSSDGMRVGGATCW